MLGGDNRVIAIAKAKEWDVLQNYGFSLREAMGHMPLLTGDSAFLFKKTALGLALVAVSLHYDESIVLCFRAFKSRPSFLLIRCWSVLTRS